MSDEKRVNPALEKTKSMFLRQFEKMQSLKDDINSDTIDDYKEAMDDTASFAVMLIADGAEFYHDEDDGKDAVVFPIGRKLCTVRESDVEKQAGGRERYKEILSAATGLIEKPTEREITKGETAGQPMQGNTQNSPFPNLQGFQLPQNVGFAEMAYLLMKSMEQQRPREVRVDSEELARAETEAVKLRADIGNLTAQKVELEKKILDKDEAIKQISLEKDAAEKTKAGIEHDLDDTRTKLKAERTGLNNKIRELNKSIADSNEQLAKLRAEKDSLESDYKNIKEKSDKAVADLKRQLEEARAASADPKELSDARAELEKLRARAESTEHERDELKQKVESLSKSNKTLQDAAGKDPVTGALTEQELQKNASKSVTMGFVKIENTDFYAGYGADMVNKVFKKVAKDLRSTFPKAYIYRVFGSYFVVGTEKTVEEVERKLKKLKEQFEQEKIETSVAAAVPEKTYDKTIASMVLNTEKAEPEQEEPTEDYPVEEQGAEAPTEPSPDIPEDELPVEEGPASEQPAEYDENDRDAPEEGSTDEPEPDDPVEIGADDGREEGFYPTEDDLEALIMDDEPEQSR